MKKRIVVLVVAFVIAFASLTFAGISDLNISEMTTDEIIELKNALTEELQTRFGYGDTIFEGLYKVGRDIKPGTFLLTCTKDDPQYSSDMDFCYYATEEALQTKQGIKLGDFAYREYLKYENSYVLNLEEGGYLYIMSGEGSITPYKASWMVD